MLALYCKLFYIPELLGSYSIRRNNVIIEYRKCNIINLVVSKMSVLFTLGSILKEVFAN